MIGNNYSMVYISNKQLSMAYIGASLCMYIVGLLTIISFSSPYWLYNKSTKINQVTNLGLWEVFTKKIYKFIKLCN